MAAFHRIATCLVRIAPTLCVLPISLFGNNASGALSGSEEIEQPSHEPVENTFDQQSVSEMSPLVEIQEVVLTGQKVDRGRQETYDSVGFIAESEIESLGIKDFRDSLRLIANVQSISANNGNSGFSIRGINSEGIEVPGGNPRPLASLIIDGAVQSLEGTRRGMRGTWDVEKIEVYRGPQSTLRGRNSLAGAIVTETNSPTSYWEGALNGEIGQQDRIGGAFMVSGPVFEDQLMFRIAGETTERELGTEFSDPVGEELDDEEYDMLRGKLLFVPRAISGFEMEFTYSYALDNPAVAVVNADDPYERAYDVGSSQAEIRENTVDSYVLDADYQFDEDWALETSYSFTNTDAVIYTPPPPGYQRDEIRSDDDFTTDLRLSYQPGSSKNFSLLLGAFYGLLNNERDSYIALVGTTGASAIVQQVVSESEIENYALYGEMTVPISENFRAVMGLRYDQESFETDAFIRWSFFNQINDSFLADDEYNTFLPRLSLEYDIDQDRSLAFTVSRGYRAGFAEPGGTVDDDQPIRIIDPEYLWSYDLGFRSQWLDQKLTVNTNVFYYYWEDMQVPFSDPSGGFLNTITENAGESKVFGGELEVQYAVFDDLTLGASLGYVKTEFIEYRELDGNEFPLSPEWNGTVWAQYDFADYWFVSGDIAYTDDFYGYGNVANLDTQIVKGYMLANMALGLERNNWSVVCYVRNLFDKEYLVGSSTSAYVGDPRTATVRVTLRF